MKLKQSFHASLEALKSVRRFIYDALKQHPSDQETRDQIVLAVDEAATNVIKHALNFDAEKTFTIEMSIGNDDIEIILSDEGPPFDPSNIPEKPDVGRRIKEKKRGGLGIYLMRTVMDEVKFTRNGGINYTIMKKKCGNKNAG